MEKEKNIKDISNKKEEIEKRRKYMEERKEGRKKRADRKKKKKNVFLNVLFLIFLVPLIISGRYIYNYMKDVKKTEDTYKEVKELFKIKPKEKEVAKDEPLLVDMKGFLEKNSDSKFVLDFPKFNIKNVVVQTNNNDYYLTRDFNRQYNIAGWLFLDYRNALNGEDKNLIVYGHNMRDGKTMLSPLVNMVNINFINGMSDEDKIIHIYDDKKNEKYKIFSVYQDRDQNISLRVPVSDEEFKQYALNMQRKSIYNFNENISDIKKMLTIATCGRTNTERVIIHAYKID